MRQTDLSLKELEAEINKVQSCYPKCMIVNEIGEICFRGDKKAEAILRRVLDSNKPCEQFPAYYWLSVLDSPDPETIAKLVAFKDNPANADVVAEAKEVLGG